MKYNVDKEKFATLLWQRPTLIKKASLENVDTVAFLVKHARRCYEYLPYKLRKDVGVIRAYIYLSEEERKRKSNYFNRNGVRLHNTPTFEELTEGERIDLIQRSNNGEIIKQYLKPTEKEWITAVKQGIDYKEIPEEYLTNKNIWKAYAEYLEETSYIPQIKIPETFWTKHTDAEEFICKMIKMCTRFLSVIPPNYITHLILWTAFQSGMKVKLYDETNSLKDIPREVWDEQLVGWH